MNSQVSGQCLYTIALQNNLSHNQNTVH